MSVRQGHVQVGRAYASRVRGDGMRILVDRLWPRGLSTEVADFDEWQKDVAPSIALRQWYGHDPELFDEFSARYRVELRDPVRARIVSHLRAVARHGNLTVITASKAAEISEAAVLVTILTMPGHPATGGSRVPSGRERAAKEPETRGVS